jgi:long-subunit fatty acid transport protein
LDTFIVNSEFAARLEGEFSSLTPALSYDVNEKLPLGIAFSIWNHDVTGACQIEERQLDGGTTELVPNFFGLPGIPRYVTTIDSGYSFLPGGMYRATKEWALAVALRLEHTLDLDVVTKSWNTITYTDGSPADVRAPNREQR